MQTPILHPKKTGFKIIKRTHIVSGQIMYLQILKRNNSYRGSSEFNFEEVRDYEAESKWLAHNFAAPTPTKNSIVEREIAPELAEEPAGEVVTDVKKMSVAQMLAAGKTEGEIMKELNRRGRAKKRPSRASKKQKTEAKKTTKTPAKKAGKPAGTEEKSEIEKLLENE